ncbi:MAG: relaxase/mobilization nuclease domain-containing protein [Flavobacteriaceae bacterium]|nr:relaxase/mobilization nuclease domain-containing protein [Flavobacteriaceae bacterium]
MIAKGKAVAHGKEVLAYIFKEGKFNTVVSANYLSDFSAEKIYKEMCQVAQFNSRCKNKFLRFEIGIAPSDEDKLSKTDLEKIVMDFANKMGLKQHQWVAATHKDTDNLHIHLVANRIGMDSSVYQTDFVSNRASKTAEEISRAMNLTIAKEVRAKRIYQNERGEKLRNEKKAMLRMLAYTTLANCISKGQMGKEGLAVFMRQLKEQGVKIEGVKNKQNKVYGLRFEFMGEVFKASEIGREFGYRSLPRQFGLDMLSQKGNTAVPVLKDNQQEMLSILASVFEVANEIMPSATDLLDTPIVATDYKEMAFQKKYRKLARRKRGMRR